MMHSVRCAGEVPRSWARHRAHATPHITLPAGGNPVSAVGSGALDLSLVHSLPHSLSQYLERGGEGVEKFARVVQVKDHNRGLS